MAVKFSLLESKCNFKTKEDNISCSLNKISLENVPADTRTVLLTESGFLPTELTRAFIICENHHQKLSNQNRSRAKSKLCSVPDIICSHKKENQKRTGWYGVKADRAVTEQKIIEIQSVTGIVVPIGTRKYIAFILYKCYLLSLKYFDLIAAQENHIVHEGFIK